VSDSHFIFPFALGPADGALKMLPNGIWEAETRVIRMESACVPATLREKTDLGVSYFYADSGCIDGCTIKSRGFKIQTEDGCDIQVQSPISAASEFKAGLWVSLTPDGYHEDSFMQSGGVYWTNMSSAYVSWEDIIQEQGQNPHLGILGAGGLTPWSRTFIYNLSNQCRGRDLIFLTPPWSLKEFPLLRNGTADLSFQQQYWENFTVQAEVCTPTIYEARVPVTALIDAAGAHATFDLLEFTRHRRPMSIGSLDNSRLDNLTFGEAWRLYTAMPSDVIVVNNPRGASGLESVSTLLSQAFKNNTDMLGNSNLMVEASKRLRARFLHELLSSSIVDAVAPSMEDVVGKRIVVERRIMVIQAVATTLAMLLLLIAWYSILTSRFASTDRRPLHLRNDPATVVGTTYMIESGSSFVSTLRSSVTNNRDTFKDYLDSKSYTLDNGTIVDPIIHSEDKVFSSTDTSNLRMKRPEWLRFFGSTKVPPEDWRPHLLHKRWLVVFIAALGAVTTTVLVLHTYAIDQKLFRTVFVRQMNLGLFKTSLSPQSVVATLVAVLISLCWDSIDKPMRTLQPYLEMSRKPLHAAQSVSLSYQFTLWIGTIVKAARRGHWLLVLVAAGTTLSQILVISMAALFDRQAVLHTQSLQETGKRIAQPTMHRHVPFGFCCGWNFRPFFLYEGLLATSQIVWLNNALDEIISGTQTPQWTRDEWIFTPVDMDNLSEDEVARDHNAADFASRQPCLFSSKTNGLLRERNLTRIAVNHRVLVY
jgi:hypothetical protein